MDAASELRIYPGVHETLDALVRRGTPLGLATGSSGTFANLVLDRHRLADYFEVVVTPGRGTPAKPHPALVNQTLNAMGLGATPDIYYVGDTANDSGAARAAGLSFAWASYGYGEECPPHTSVVLGELCEVRTL
jgi:phosphoglycolate phosphatase